MGLILNIETAIDNSSISLAKHGEVMSTKQHPHSRESAAWIQPAIRELLNETGEKIENLDAVALSNGPGSYTGLRVGMATAKGLCFALDIPLITLNTLKLMASSIYIPEGLLCPMIDARRMEVFTAVYDKQLSEVMAPTNLILNEESFAELLETGKLVFFGNGSNKFRAFTSNINAEFRELAFSAENMAPLSENAFNSRHFTDLAYSEPFYGKEFFSPAFRPFE